MWTCQEVCESLSFLLDNIFVRFGEHLYRQVVGIPMGTNCAPLVADLFLYCYERNFMLKLSKDDRHDVITAFNNCCRYLDDILNLNNPYFHDIFKDIYPAKLKLNKANGTDKEANFLDLHLCIENNTISTKIYTRETILISILLTFHIWMVMFLALHLMEHTFHNLSVLLGVVQSLRISTNAIFC